MQKIRLWLLSTKVRVPHISSPILGSFGWVTVGSYTILTELVKYLIYGITYLKAKKRSYSDTSVTGTIRNLFGIHQIRWHLIQLFCSSKRKQKITKSLIKYHKQKVKPHWPILDLILASRNGVFSLKYFPCFYDWLKTTKELAN